MMHLLVPNCCFSFLSVLPPEAMSVVWALAEHAGRHKRLFSSAVKIHLHPSETLSQPHCQSFICSAGALDFTSACWWLLAPLAVGLALGCGRSLQGVAFVAGEAHHVIVVEAVACSASVDRAARVATRDSYSWHASQSDMSDRS